MKKTNVAAKNEHLRDLANASMRDLPEAFQEMEEAFKNNIPQVHDSPEVIDRKAGILKKLFDDLIEVSVRLATAQGSNTMLATVAAVMPDDWFEDKRLCQVFLYDRPGSGPGSIRILPYGAELELEPGDVVKVGQGKTGPLILDKMEAGFVHYGEIGTVSSIDWSSDFPFRVQIQDGQFNTREVRAMASPELPREPEKGEAVEVANGCIVAVVGPEKASHNKFEYQPNPALTLEALVGEVPHRAALQLLAQVEAYFAAPGSYLSSEQFGGGGSYNLFVGPSGCGKTICFDTVVAEAARRHPTRIVPFRVPSSCIHSGIVGSAGALINEFTELSHRLREKGQLLMLLIGEGERLIASRRNIHAVASDGGAGYEVISGLLNATSGDFKSRLTGILTIDLNLNQYSDSAVLPRFASYQFAQLTPADMMEILRRIHVRSPELFEGEWEEFGAVVVQALPVVVGYAQVGPDRVDIRVADLVSGRMAEQAVTRSILDCNAIKSLVTVSGPQRITPAVLMHAMVQFAHSTVPQNEADAQDILLPVVGPEKIRSVTRPRALPWREVQFPPELDIRDYMAGLGLMAAGTV